MAGYAEIVEQNELFKQYDQLVGFDDISSADVTALKGLVFDVADIVGPHLDWIKVTFPQYTEHDLRHLLNVADIIARFLPKQTEGPSPLNALELTYLWLAILLHDVGMFVSEADEKQAILDSDEYKEHLRKKRERREAAEKAEQVGQTVRAQAIRDAIFAEFIRQRHAERVGAYVETHLNGKLRFQGAKLSPEVVSLCESHDWGVIESNDARHPSKCVKALETRKLIGKTPVNLAYLACCLRLGDILDFDRTRTPLSAFYTIHFTEDLSIQEWNKHLSIDGREITEHRAVYDANCEKPDDYVAVHHFLDWVDRELQQCGRLVREFPSGYEQRYQLNLAPVVDRHQIRMANPDFVAGAFRFRLDYQQILRLLMDKSLYPDSTLFLRELLQNSLDACRYQKALAEEQNMADKYVPRIQVQDLSTLPHNPADPDNGPRIIFRDNGVGMSQHQVENFFMRVGKSYYRSPEFEAERDRLSDKNIHLDACSQFGIGFLSCFLGGQRIEVTTYRYGSEPLNIQINGPGKYFLIQRLSKPQDEVRYNSPPDPADDQPPQYAGTTVTVHLRKGWHNTADESSEDTEDDAPRDLVWNTLNSFAVNQEFPVSVTDVGGNERELPARRWDSEAPEFCGTDDAEMDESYFAPAVFSLNDPETMLRGTGAIWMLNDAGSPVPCKGCLQLQCSWYGSGLAVGVEDVVRFAQYVLRPCQRCTDELEKVVVDTLQRLEEDPAAAEQILDGLNSLLREIKSGSFDTSEAAQIARRLSDDHFEWLRAVADVLPSIASRGYQDSWRADPDEVVALIAGNRNALLEVWRKHGISTNDSCDLDTSYRCALFGIEAPGGFQTWSPAQAEARRHSWLPGGASVGVDMYGTLAPQPAASRLFVPYERSHEVRTAVTRAFLRHGDRLRKEHPDSQDWQDWFRMFLGTWRGDEMAAAVREEEFLLIEDALTVECYTGDTTELLSPRELCERFGSEVRISEYSFEVGIESEWWLHGYGQPWERAKHGDTVDLTRLAQQLGL
jgi:hypothetical protein